MFNLGGDDKEKLKENMEEIKDLVNSQAEQAAQQEGLPQDNNENDVDMQQPSQPSQQQGNTVQENEGQKEGEIENIKNEIESAFHRGSKETNKPEDPVQDSNPQNSIEDGIENSINTAESPDFSQEENLRPKEIEDPVQDLDLDQESNFSTSQEGLSDKSSNQDQAVPNNNVRNEMNAPRPPSGEDTLFIEVDDFQNIKERVEEMKYLSQEMKDLMSSLEEGLDEDRRIEGEVQDVLSDFRDRRESIQSSIN